MAVHGWTKQAPKPPKKKEYNRITEDVINLDDDDAHEQIQALPPQSKITTMHAGKQGDTMYGTYTKE